MLFDKCSILSLCPADVLEIPTDEDDFLSFAINKRGNK
jgi:hypothetical protein